MAKNTPKIFMGYIIISFVFSIFSTSFAAVLPTFAIVDKNDTKTSSYITQESSIQTTANPTFDFQSASQILIEQNTGTILFANAENEQMLPASVTKIMTILLIMDAIDNGQLSLTDTVTCSANASKIGGSQIWFKEGEQLTIDEALKCICVVSANDVCIAMAELLAGNEANFVQMMNEKAKELGMENTHFMNAHGIDEENHFSCAKDIAIMSRELMTKHPDITKYTTIWMDTIRQGTFNLTNTNKLLKSYDGITGLKTGSTSAAGFNLSATATRNGLSLIAVVLKAPSSEIRNKEITELLNYGFSSYEMQTYAKKGETLDSIHINKHIGNTVDIQVAQDVTQVVEKGKIPNVTRNVKLNENITAPLKSNDIIGQVIFTNENGESIAQSDIIVTQDVTRSTFLEYLKEMLTSLG